MKLQLARIQTRPEPGEELGSACLVSFPPREGLVPERDIQMEVFKCYKKPSLGSHHE